MAIYQNFTRRDLLASGLVTTLLPENSNQLCGRLGLKLQVKGGGKDRDKLDENIDAMIDNLCD